MMTLLCLGVVFTAAPASFRTTIDETRMVHAINDYRADRKLPALLVDRTLMRVARQRVDVFDHCHPRYGWVRAHARGNGFSGFCTDNIARGYPTPESAVGDANSGWGCEIRGQTVGHDMQMKGYAKVNGRWVNYRFNRVGVARSGRNYIAIFGRKESL
jgi:hypothetical protein